MDGEMDVGVGTWSIADSGQGRALLLIWLITGVIIVATVLATLQALGASDADEPSSDLQDATQVMVDSNTWASRVVLLAIILVPLLIVSVVWTMFWLRDRVDSQGRATTNSPAEGPSAIAPGNPQADGRHAKENKRAARIAKRERRRAASARLSKETVGKLEGFRVFNDGTVQKEASWEWTPWSDRPWILRPRSVVLRVTFHDTRIRKPFARMRHAAGEVSLGLIGGGEDHFGGVKLTLVTAEWSEEISATSGEQIARLEALHLMLEQAQRGSTAGADLDSIQAQSALASPQNPSPPPAPPASPPSRDVPAALRELKALHDEGILTLDEFEARRQPLVAQLTHDPNNGPPAGWFPDPSGAARLRWWDGRAWTSHTAS